MSGNEMQRGYDDTNYLTEMATGLVSRRYASVDEAAKAVLREDAGSNVDRLRRKFREQGWYDKGLAAHVEAEIASRGLIAEPGYHRTARQIIRTVTTPFESLRRFKTAAAPMSAIRPKTSLMAFSLATTILFAAAASGIVGMSTVLLIAVFCCVAILVAWADRTSETVTAWTAGIHLCSLGVLTASLVAVFGYSDAAPEFTMGSPQGALATSIGLTIMGVYATSFIGTRTRLTGTRKTLEMGLLIAALSVLSQSGTAILVHDGFASTAHAATIALATR
ncbi:hypothetical protein D3C71_277670 [compost metagenome]